jgi:hypothetical protein
MNSNEIRSLPSILTLSRFTLRVKRHGLDHNSGQPGLAVCVVRPSWPDIFMAGSTDYAGACRAGRDYDQGQRHRLSTNSSSSRFFGLIALSK